MKKGFTLIELLIVITIIGILAVAFVPQILGAPSKARDTERIAGLQKLAAALTQDSILSNLPGDSSGGADPHCVDADIDDDGTNDLDIADFGGTLPADPAPDNNFAADSDLNCPGEYGYILGPNTDYSFGVYAHLENWESANAVCSSAFAGTISKPTAATDADELCYAILVQ